MPRLTHKWTRAEVLKLFDPQIPLGEETVYEELIKTNYPNRVLAPREQRRMEILRQVYRTLLLYGLNTLTDMMVPLLNNPKGLSRAELLQNFSVLVLTYFEISEALTRVVIRIYGVSF